MSTPLQQELIDIIDPTTYGQDICHIFRSRLEQGSLTRDENPESHFCVYFLPYDQAQRRVLLGAHKKSGLWLSPGGHIDRNESLLQAVNRENYEELGLKDVFPVLPKPFFLSVANINGANVACQNHFDTWFLLKTDGTSLQIDPAEFSETRWVTFEESLSLLNDPPSIEALRVILK